MLHRYRADRAEASRSMVCGQGNQLTLIDVSGCSIQSAKAFEAFRAALTDPAGRAALTAFVVGSALARIQVVRMIAGEEDIAVFGRRDVAESWISASPQHRAATRQPGRTWVGCAPQNRYG